MLQEKLREYDKQDPPGAIHQKPNSFRIISRVVEQIRVRVRVRVRVRDHKPSHPTFSAVSDSHCQHNRSGLGLGLGLFGYVGP